MQEVSKLFGCVSHDRTHIYPGEGGGVLVVPFLVTNVVLVPLRVFSFKTFSVVPFVVPLNVEIWQRFMTVLSKTFKRGKSAMEPT